LRDRVVLKQGKFGPAARPTGGSPFSLQPRARPLKAACFCGAGLRAGDSTDGRQTRALSSFVFRPLYASRARASVFGVAPSYPRPTKPQAPSPRSARALVSVPLPNAKPVRGAWAWAGGGADLGCRGPCDLRLPVGSSGEGTRPRARVAVAGMRYAAGLGVG
jgi:hypothetical protein